MPEFNRIVLEALREPLESGQVIISRASFQTQFPAKFQLVAAMNPCPCGYLGSSNAHCRCTAEQIQRYQARISGPFLDRIDLYIEVPPLPKGMLSNVVVAAESSALVRAHVAAARRQQYQRLGKVNAVLLPKDIDQICQLNQESRQFLEFALEKLNLSARAYHRVLKVARTIADLENSEAINVEHVTEAVSYRRMFKRN